MKWDELRKKEVNIASWG